MKTSRTIMISLGLLPILAFCSPPGDTKKNVAPETVKQTGNVQTRQALPPQSTNPLEKAYKQLSPLMESKEALDIMEKEYPKQQVDIVSNQYTREYAWRWTWSNADKTTITESASLTIYFSRRGDCVICRVKNAVYTYKRGDKKERKSLLDNNKFI